uniref:Peptidase A1 domain-containing protein n=1 Tax=Angiostrongylus cantonensis TaxID=6313 RepID=A0A0K0D056_ANGCA
MNQDLRVFCLDNKSCASKQKFKPGSSSTFTKSNKTWSGKYEKGFAKGVLGTDIMKFGGLDEEQLAVPNTTFGLANHVSSDLEEDAADGILGLAFTALATDNAVPPLINAINQNLLDKPLFTVWLQSRRSNITAEGLVTYGAIDTKNCGPISAVGMGNFTHTQVYEAASDSGTTLIGGPKAVIDLLAKTAGATYNASEDLYFIDCSFTVPTLDFTIGSNKYSIDRANYVIEVKKNVCIMIIYSSQSGGFRPDWLLGTPFIHQYCNIFDIGQKRIGFAVSL